MNKVKIQKIYVIFFSVYYCIRQLTYLTFLQLNSNIILINNLLKVTIVIFSLIIIGLFLHYTVKQYILFLILMVLTILCWLISKNSEFILIVLFSFSLKGIEFKTFVKLLFKLNIAIFSFILFLFFIKVIPQRIELSTIRFRQSLGFWHPNVLSLSFAVIFIQYLYLYFKNVKTVYMLGFITLTYYFYSVSNSRTTGILMILICILYFCLRMTNNKTIKNIIFIGSISLAPIFALVSYLMAKLYNPSSVLSYKLDTFFNNRVRLSNDFLREYGFNLFGNKVTYASPNSYETLPVGFVYQVLDNGYMKLLINFGLVLLLGYLFFIISLSLKEKRNVNNYAFIIPLVFYSIAGVMEQSILDFGTNFLLFGLLIFLQPKEKFI